MKSFGIYDRDAFTNILISLRTSFLPSFKEGSNFYLQNFDFSFKHQGYRFLPCMLQFVGQFTAAFHFF